MSLGHLGSSYEASKIRNYGLTKKKLILKPGLAIKKSLVTQKENMKRQKEENQSSRNNQDTEPTIYPSISFVQP